MTRSLDTYRMLGRSGLRVSPLALGTLTFGADWGWGSEPNEARQIFDAYLDRGGNFHRHGQPVQPTATSERLVGEFANGLRDRLVIATKYTLSTRPGDPNSGGNHRKSMVQAVEASLRRLNTDYIDLYYLHAWDGTTPVDEVMRAMDDLVRAGKVLYVAVSDVPAWQVARMQTMADLRGWSPLVALQIEYSLIERTVERDLIPMAAELGMGVIPWSPLASGVLVGKYTRDDLDHGGGSAEAIGTRKSIAAANGALSERGLDIADVVKKVAAEHRDYAVPGCAGLDDAQPRRHRADHRGAHARSARGQPGGARAADPRRRAGQPGRSQRYQARFPARVPGPADDPQ